MEERVCPVERAGGLESWFRKLVHNPDRILGKYVRQGMTVVDAGCGPGAFTVPLAKMVGGNGKVIAVDLQQGMLDKLEAKIKGTEIKKIITLHKCNENNLGVKQKADFILAFYMVHEVPDIGQLLREFKTIMKKGAKLYLVEPSFHVGRKEFNQIIGQAKSLGFREIERPGIFLSRAVVLGL